MRSLADEVPFDIPDSWEWVRLGSIVYNRGQITPSTDFCYIDIGSILEDCRLMQATLTDCTGIDAEIESLLEEIDVVAELTKRCIAENSQTAQNQNEYAARHNGFVERYEKAKAQLEQLRTIKAARRSTNKAKKRPTISQLA